MHKGNVSRVALFFQVHCYPRNRKILGFQPINFLSTGLAPAVCSHTSFTVSQVGLKMALNAFENQMKQKIIFTRLTLDSIFFGLHVCVFRFPASVYLC